MGTDSTDMKEFIVKIDENDEETTDGTQAAVTNRRRNEDSRFNADNIWRRSSYDFEEDNNDGKNKQKTSNGNNDKGFDFLRSENAPESPPSKLIGQFLHKQKASGDFSLDLDLGMSELRHQEEDGEFRGLPTVPESPASVSFDTSAVANGTAGDAVRKRNSKDLPPNGTGNDGEVIRCSSNKAFQRNSSLLKTKAKSRLQDPPPKTTAEKAEMKSGRVKKSGQLKSGFTEEEEEDDPFRDEDLPDEYKKDKLSFWILLEWVSLIVIIAALVCSLAIPFLKKKTLWDLGLWKWAVLILVLICGRLVSSWIVRIAVFFIERNFLLRKRVLYFVYGVKRAVQNCLWLGLVLIAWSLLFNKKVEREAKNKSLSLQHVTHILICLVVSVLLWLVKTLLVKVLASSFHMSTYFDRIQEALFNQYAIETLSGPPLIESRKIEEEEEIIAKEVRSLQNAGAVVPPNLKAVAAPRIIGSGVLQKSPRGGKSPAISGVLSKQGDDQGITIDNLHKLTHKNVSAWRMKRLMNMIRYGALSTLDEQIQDSCHGDENATQIRSEHEAKLAARKMFHNVAKPGSKYIYVEDIMRFMRDDEAVKTMSLFEGECDNKKISKSSLKNWVVNAFRERRALALTLNDTKTAVNRLHKVANVVVCIILVIIWLLILQIATTKFLLFMSSQLVVVAFIFGNSCKTVFEAIIFLFVMHPFDVGDRCEIEGVQMVVEEMNILTTVFLRYDNQKIIYPNSVLATKAISNYYRSPDMGDGIEFCIHISTPAEKIAEMKQRIVSYVENKNDHWYPAPMIVFKDMEALNMVKIAVWLTHRMNHQDMGEKWARRSQLVEEIAKICRELDMQYRLYPLDINVRNMPIPLPTSDRLPPNWTQRN